MKRVSIVTKFKRPIYQTFKDTHSEKAQSNNTPALTKSTNMGISVVSTSN